VKRLSILILLSACGPSGPEEYPEPAVREAPPLETKTPEPDIDEDFKAADRLEGTLDVEEIMELGVDMHEAKEQLSGMHKVVVFLECLKESTGKDDIDGPEMERHVVRNTKHARRCKKKLANMADEEIADEANAWIGKRERSK